MAIALHEDAVWKQAESSVPSAAFCVIISLPMSPFDFVLTASTIDEALFTILVWFGWVPIAVTLFWGFAQMFRNHRQGVYSSRLEWVLLSISVPATTEQSPKALENMFATIYGSKSGLLWKEIWIQGKYNPSFSFEIASTEGNIAFYVRTLTRFRDLIEASIYAHYPEAEIYEVEDYAAFAPSVFPNGEYEAWGAEMRLKKDQIFPIRTYEEFEDRLSQELKDPLAQTLEMLGKMGPGEHMWIQFVIQAAENDWKDEGIKYIRKAYGVEEKAKPGLFESSLNAVLEIPNMAIEELTGISFLGDSAAGEDDPFRALKIPPDEKERSDAILRKLSKTGYNTKTRIVYLAKSDAFKKVHRTALVKGALNQFSHLNMNSFGLYGPSVPKDDYFWQRWQYHGKQTNLVNAYKGRSFGVGADPKILNTEELATLWHFPQVGVKAPLIEKAFARRAEPPTGLPFGADSEADLPTGPHSPVPEPGEQETIPTESLPAPEELPGLADIPVEVLPENTVPAPPRPTKPVETTEKAGDVPSNLPF